MRNNPVSPERREGGGGVGSLGTSAGIALQPVEKTVVEQIFSPAAHGGPQWSRYPHCSLWSTPDRAGSWRELRPVESRQEQNF